MSVMIRVALALWMLVGASVQAADQQKVTVAVERSSLLGFLPITIAKTQGFFAEQQLDVSIQTFETQDDALAALREGRADAAGLSYDRLLRSAAEGAPVLAIIAISRMPGFVLGVRPDLTGAIKTIADLRGRRLGIAGRGSASAGFAHLLLARYGLRSEDVAFVSAARTEDAIRMLAAQEIDGIMTNDPTATVLSARSRMRPLVDTRTEEGVQQAFGIEELPGAVLTSMSSFVRQRPQAAQGLVKGIHKALVWLKAASPDDVADVVPLDQYEDKSLYTAAVGSTLPSFSRDGEVDGQGHDLLLRLIVMDGGRSIAVPLNRVFDRTFLQNAAGENDGLEGSGSPVPVEED